MTENDLNTIVNELKTVYYDITAESIIIELQKNSRLKDRFFIRNKSSFHRSYTRDVIKFEKSIDNKQLILNLSRNGIYDSLPEGFFHKPASNKPGDYQANRKTKKAEEENARSLFAPIENELFEVLIAIKKNERHIYDNFYDVNNEFLVQFWNFKEYLSNKYILKLIRILPHSHKIAGNIDLAKLCLEKILGEKVHIRKFFKPVKIPQKKEQNTLGVNFVATSEFSEVATPFITVSIGPIKHLHKKKYFENQEITEFLNIFYSYFLPLEFKIETKFISSENESFILHEKENPIMGVSTKI